MLRLQLPRIDEIPNSLELRAGQDQTFSRWEHWLAEAVERDPYLLLALELLQHVDAVVQASVLGEDQCHLMPKRRILDGVQIALTKDQAVPSLTGLSGGRDGMSDLFPFTVPPFERRAAPPQKSSTQRGAVEPETWSRSTPLVRGRIVERCRCEGTAVQKPVRFQAIRSGSESVTCMMENLAAFDRTVSCRGILPELRITAPHFSEPAPVGFHASMHAQTEMPTVKGAGLADILYWQVQPPN
jgi:hypothetical protein